MSAHAQSPCASNLEELALKSMFAAASVRTCFGPSLWRLGAVTTYTRDAFNNLTSIQASDGTLATLLWGYGGNGIGQSSRARFRRRLL